MACDLGPGISLPCPRHLLIPTWDLPPYAPNCCLPADAWVYSLISQNSVTSCPQILSLAAGISCSQPFSLQLCPYSVSRFCPQLCQGPVPSCPKILSLAMSKLFPFILPFSLFLSQLPSTS